MTAFLVIIVILLFGISVWQMNRIFQLAKTKPLHHPDIATDKDNNQQGYLMMGFLAFIYILTIVSFWLWYDTLLPESGSEHGSKIDNLMLISMIIIFFVGIVTQAILHYFAFIYRGNKVERATFYADNDKLEFIWTIIPVIVLAGLIIYGLFTWTDIMNVDKDDDPLIVELYAQQFNWKARYGGNDNTLGEANVRLIEGVNQLGVDPADPNGQDDKIVTELHLPVGRKVLIKMRSQDVLHSAYMPHFRAQMNCVPGMITQFAFTPTITTADMRMNDHIVEKVANINNIRKDKSEALIANGEEALEPYEFDYVLLCNKICGISHYNMQMKIIVESEEDYKAWLAEQPTLAEQLSK
ncbi:cytochrome c oxidase subunit II [Aequorivita vladivostokensis]|jgi:cytochrome c oxidase subunit II|uniref:Cytochrome c oxidase subunit 2 n=1 Tax=Aequorivita vladivostokensis TaxID=171194 RepID=A0ABR5DLX7_9FLAO|nr:cytochrome c oxidase subunit II [Aequorivita vladivostokensis]KJJ39773.1 cytochrome C oxidase subunit II [Aequorivita vladivostokensis]MAO47174.1 cytochrome C oxidase subunit II [Aequorivita sp.]HAV53658.1 cytochrome c oxidase subunit II [Aequorivita sp.]|tara:strand:+ start:14821 stop:15882 length:1062 start_codon:yes stop_codon:yes gene_type:complete